MSEQPTIAATNQITISRPPPGSIRQVMPPPAKIRQMIDLSNKLAVAFGSGKSPTRMKPEEIFLRIWKAWELNIPALQGVEHIRTFDGNISTSARLKAAMVMHAGGKITMQEHTADRVAIRFERPDSESAPVTIVWDRDRATAAGLVNKQNWKGYQPQMLMARCLGEGCDLLWPDITSGCGYTMDELGDTEDEGELLDVEFVDATPDRFKEKPAAPSNGSGHPPADALAQASPIPEIPTQAQPPAPVPDRFKKQEPAPLSAIERTLGAEMVAEMQAAADAPAVIVQPPTAAIQAQQKANAAADRPVTTSQLEVLASIKRWAKITQQEWIKLLVPYGTTSAKTLTYDDARAFIQSMIDRYTPGELRIAGINLEALRGAGYRVPEVAQPGAEGESAPQAA